MKNKTRLFLVGTFSLILIAAVWAVPPATHVTGGVLAIEQSAAPPRAAAQTQSASGTISAVDNKSFTITLPPPKNLAVEANLVQDTPKTMTFVIDKNTTIEGKLRVGASADVTYRDDNGEHVAIGVRVTPPQS
jgi:Cu/Ag efflux protein CusF